MKNSSFQEIILKLQNFWAAHGCLITQPYYTQVGAGTMNPATFLRALGPEPWNVAYVEPSVRPDDGRYGENPNRLHMFYQYQVILKPDPGNPQELYLESLKALGIDPRQHDIRFVEDNWEQPAISAWGLGWEVWLDGQEITQFTYFQQMGGVALDPVSVEITYGLERILIALNNAKDIWHEEWGAGVTYGEIRHADEVEHSKYYFEVADVERIRAMYDLFSAEADACLAAGLIVPAHDYVLKCSHSFNILDTRGAISVAERQAFFRRIRELAKGVAESYKKQRDDLGNPLRKPTEKLVQSKKVSPPSGIVSQPSDFVLEIGVEELPAQDVDVAVEQLRLIFDKNVLGTYKLAHDSLKVFGTPRRLAVYISQLTSKEPDDIVHTPGPPESAAFDKDGKPTQALIGWARKYELPSSIELTRENLVHERDGKRYVDWQKPMIGLSTDYLLATLLPNILPYVKFEKAMRWIDHGEENIRKTAFSRPIRWLVCMFGDQVIPFEYAGVASGNISRGLRPYDSPEIKISSADKYFDVIRESGIVLDKEERKASIVEQVKQAAALVGGEAIIDDDLLNEVTNLIEMPTAVMGGFDKDYLTLPRDVLISVMKKHQRYFPVQKKSNVESQKSSDGATFDLRPSTLLPNFIAMRNGDDIHVDIVREGNEHVLGARFADANFFVREDVKNPLEYYRAQLSGLTFHTKLGSMLDKSERMLKLAEDVAGMLKLSKEETFNVQRSTFLAKADLVTQMVTEMTSLQGIVGREYALRSGEQNDVAVAIGEQYQPVPLTKTGLAIALADRLDSLVGLFAAGLAPTGAKDPFGLRRAAIGVVQPLIEHDIDFDLADAVKKSGKTQPITVSDEVQKQILDFITGRLSVVLKDMGYKHDVVEAVLAAQSNNPAGTVRAVKQLSAWVEREDWSSTLDGFARCVRITRDKKTTFQVDSKNLVEKEEKDLFKALEKAEKTKRAEASVDDLLNAFVPVIPAVNAFFDKVLVMAEDKKLQENRLGLLQRIARLSSGVADLSKLEGF